MTAPVRVVVIGGGCAGLTAAYELTRPEQAGRFSVTVYQPGWRLGGKGASSRGRYGRIEEHGIHLWLGCYENSFRMIRDVYAAVAPSRASSPIRTWRDAFTPVTHVGLGRLSPSAGWDVWSTYFPPMPGLPGDPPDASSPAEDPFSVVGYCTRAVITLGILVELAVAAPSRSDTTASLSELGQRSWSRGQLVDRARSIIAGGVEALASPARILDALRLLLGMLGSPTPSIRPLALQILDLAADALAASVRRDDAAARDTMSVIDVVELLTTGVRGCIADGAVGGAKGFDVLDDWEFRDWLRHHGASARCIDSPFVRGMYSLMFAFRQGDARRPCLSAGVFLRVCARMFFTYRGALFWRMAAGMGEIVFAPIYECLRDRGVRFEFFHRLERVRLAPPQAGTTDGPEGPSSVAALELNVQARTRDGAEYMPLIDVGGLACWPDRPLWDQLDVAPPTSGEVDYEALWCTESSGVRTLQAGRDFDIVVIAMGFGALPYACSELIERHATWRAAFERVETVATQAAQLWLDPTISQLGWDRGPIMMTGFAPPFDSWGDMSNLVQWEAWPVDHTPGSLSYFCNVLPDDAAPEAWATADYANTMRKTVRRSLDSLLDDELPLLWPNARGADGRFDRRLLAGTFGDEDPVASQYYRANTNPSDRYVMSVPGSSGARLSALDRHCTNLTVAGDWTACGVNVGCIEAAVMSGMLAAHAVSGDLPRTDDIVGYHHP